LRQLVTDREVLTFLAVGGTGYVVDVAAFNALRMLAPLSTMDPSVARTLAVGIAMCVTYVGNRWLTWPSESEADRRREVALFVLFNVIGYGFSVVCLVVSHDLLGLTSPLADNLSANLVGVALGTLFRFVTYRRFVFASGPSSSPSSSQSRRLAPDDSDDASQGPADQPFEPTRASGA
jgi:putative flippase GtrA